MTETTNPWTKDQQRTLMETYRRNTIPLCPTDKTQLQVTMHGSKKGRLRQIVHYLCTTCNTQFEFSPTNEDAKWRRMNAGKK